MRTSRRVVVSAAPAWRVCLMVERGQDAAPKTQGSAQPHLVKGTPKDRVYVRVYYT